MSVSGNIEQSRQFLLLLFLQTTHPTALFISLLPSSRAELSLSPPPLQSLFLFAEPALHRLQGPIVIFSISSCSLFLIIIFGSLLLFLIIWPLIVEVCLFDAGA
ncbi:unnamed protein product [Prunus armeniaca]|uniref:Uncharacterized protein n=1 Tax=Prunus armeniaca TaxID=36596 RepID=A0A6J5V5Q2_PRUAR|nr:unnamed protein product [Prunus armeniaca]